MKRVLSGAVAGAMMMLISFPLLAQNDSVSMEALRQCREYSDIGKRLSCYDHIGEPAPIVETTTVPADADPQDTAAGAAEVSEEVENDSLYRDLTDDIGLPKSDDAYETIHATVVRCGEANNRKFYFYFDNGQIWKYIGGKRLRYKSCNAPANLTEDGFGFRLQIDGKPGLLRVQRVK